MAATASYDRTETWKQCCMKVLGFDDNIDHVGSEVSDSTPFLNLLPSNYFENDSSCVEEEIDPWLATTQQLQANIQEMNGFLNSKKSSFAVSMLDQEASLVQTTLTSFTAQTAVELERLHATASSPHRIGMIQILMGCLKEEIADPFARLAKKRSASVSVPLYQNPLQCRVLEPKDDGTVLGALDDDIDQRFTPTRPTHRLHEDFWDSYATPNRDKPVKPTSWLLSVIAKQHPDDAVDEDVAMDESVGYTPRPLTDHPTVQGSPIEDEPWTNQTDAGALQEESMALQQQMAQHNELDSIHQVESAMVTITQMMSQFADLVSEQHANVFVIHDNVDNAARAVQQGKDALVDAKEKTVSSHHYMAKGIAAMGVMLLLFHFLHS